MNTNIKWLKEEISTKSQSEMPEGLKKSYDTYREFTDSWTDYSYIEEDADLLRVLGTFRDKYEAATAKKPSTPQKPSTPKKSDDKAKGMGYDTHKPSKPAKFKDGDNVIVPNVKLVGVVYSKQFDMYNKGEDWFYSVSFEGGGSLTDIPEESLKLAKPKSTAKAKTAAKSSSKIKKAKAGRKANAKPRPKKETPVAATTATKADSSSSKKSKPANRKPKTVNPKPPKPEKVKKPTADEKAADKAWAEIRDLDRDIATYEKRIKDDSGIVDRIAASWMDQSKSIKSTLGALPNDLREELLMKRRKKAILAKIIKRDAKYFESAAKTLKKANQLPDRLAADLESVSMTLGSLNRKAAEKKAQKPEKKGFFGKIFG